MKNVFKFAIICIILNLVFSERDYDRLTGTIRAMTRGNVNHCVYSAINVEDLINEMQDYSNHENFNKIVNFFSDEKILRACVLSDSFRYVMDLFNSIKLRNIDILNFIRQCNIVSRRYNLSNEIDMIKISSAVIKAISVFYPEPR